MTTRIAALATSVSALCLYVFSNIAPNDPYFYFVSASSAVSIARLVIAYLILNLAFKNGFTFWLSRPLCAAIAVCLSIFGLAGIFNQPLGYALSNTIMPFDYMFVLGSGLFIGFRTLALKPGKQRLPLPYLKLLQPRLLSRSA